MLAESSKRFDETLIADLKTGADAFGGARLGRMAEQGEDLIRERIARHEIRAIERHHGVLEEELDRRVFILKPIFQFKCGTDNAEFFRCERYSNNLHRKRW